MNSGGIGGLVERDGPGYVQGGMGLEGEGCDDAEVGAAAFEGFEESWVLGGSGLGYRAVGGYELGIVRLGADAIRRMTDLYGLDVICSQPIQIRKCTKTS